MADLLSPGWNNPNPDIDAGNKITGWYQQYLGRTPSQDEINAHLQNPGGNEAVQQLIQNSPEAKAYAASKATPSTDPSTTDPATKDYGNTTAPTSASSQMGGPGMLDPWLQPFNAPQTSLNIPGAPTIGPAPTLGAPSQGAYSNAAFTAPGDGSFSYGDYQAPDAYSNPAFQAPDKFVAPDDVTMQNDPGWKFRQKTGQQEFLNSAAAKGLTRSGGTMKDFINYNQDAASQEYGQVYNRSLGEWNTDYAAKLGTYNTNTANAANVYNTNTAEGLAAYNTNRNNAFQNYTTNFNDALQGYQTNTANASNVWNTNWGAQKDVYNAAEQGWQAQAQLAEDQWKTQVSTATSQNQVSWNQDWQQYLQQYDAFKRNQEWPYQVLNQQSQPVG